jgi:hypothetical protein
MVSAEGSQGYQTRTTGGGGEALSDRPQKWQRGSSPSFLAAALMFRTIKGYLMEVTPFKSWKKFEFTTPPQPWIPSTPIRRPLPFFGLKNRGSQPPVAAPVHAPKGYVPQTWERFYFWEYLGQKTISINCFPTFFAPLCDENVSVVWQSMKFLECPTLWHP